MSVTVVLREIQDNTYTEFFWRGGQTRCITGDVQMAIGTQSRLWGLAAIVGVEENGVISKGTGRCPALSLATGVKKNSVSFRVWQPYFFLSPQATPMSEKNNDKPSSVSVGLNLVSCFLSWVLIRLNSWPSTVYSFSMRRTIHFFQIHSYHLITHVRKLNT